MKLDVDCMRSDPVHIVRSMFSGKITAGEIELQSPSQIKISSLFQSLLDEQRLYRLGLIKPYTTLMRYN